MAADDAVRPGGPAVVCEGVGLQADGRAILTGVTLRLAPGAIHCLVGPNGAGKTSLLRCLLGQAEHTGSVRREWPGRGAPGRIGFVPQTPDLDRTLPVTAEDFLVLVAQDRPAFLGTAKERRAEIAAALAAVGLEAQRTTRLGRLSGGEWKRLLLAQALLPPPDLLVLDEPTNHLDGPGVERALALLRERRAAGATIVCSLHDLAQVRALADTVTALAGGRVAFSGTPAEVLTPERLLRVFAGGEAG